MIQPYPLTIGAGGVWRGLRRVSPARECGLACQARPTAGRRAAARAPTGGVGGSGRRAKERRHLTARSSRRDFSVSFIFGGECARLSAGVGLLVILEAMD